MTFSSFDSRPLRHKNPTRPALYTWPLKPLLVSNYRMYVTRVWAKKISHPPLPITDLIFSKSAQISRITYQVLSIQQVYRSKWCFLIFPSLDEIIAYNQNNFVISSLWEQWTLCPIKNTPKNISKIFHKTKPIVIKVCRPTLFLK